MISPIRTRTSSGNIITFQSAASVGLIVQSEVDDDAYNGVFLTPELARKIAAELLAIADAAQADYERTSNLTDDKKHAMVVYALGDSPDTLKDRGCP